MITVVLYPNVQNICICTYVPFIYTLMERVELHLKTWKQPQLRLQHDILES